MIPKELKWESPPQPAHTHSLVHGCGAAKHPGAAEYSQHLGNCLEIRLGQRFCPAISPEKSSLKKGFGLKFGFIHWIGLPLHTDINWN